MNNAQRPSIDLIGYGLALSGASLFATKGVFIKLAFAEGVSTEALLALRMLIAFPVYAVILIVLLRQKPELKQLISGKTLIATMAVGALGYYVSSYLDFAGLAFVSAQYERLVLFTYPFFVVLFGVWFFRQPMIWPCVPPMLVSYAGLLVVFVWNLSVEPEGLLEGSLLVLGSALTFALYQHLARAQMRVLGSALFTCIAMMSASVLAIGQSAITDGVATYASFSAYVWVIGLLLGLVGTVVPSFLINTAISRIGPSATSSTAAFGPIVTIFLAVAILGEAFTPYHALGTTLVLVGTWLFARVERQAKSKAV